MDWSEVALLVTGAALSHIGAFVQARLDRRARQEEQEDTSRQTRRGRVEEQTRAALLEIVVQLQRLSTTAEKRADDIDVQVADMVVVLRRQSIQVGDADLRARIELARECLEWSEVIADSHLGAGIVYLTRYIAGDLEPAIGAYLRDETVPGRSQNMAECEAVLRDEWSRGQHC